MFTPGSMFSYSEYLVTKRPNLHIDLLGFNFQGKFVMEKRKRKASFEAVTLPIHCKKKTYC